MLTASSRTDHILGGVQVALSACLFGVIIILAKVATGQGLPIPIILGVRFAMATGLLAILLRVLRQSFRPASGEGPWLAALAIGGYVFSASLVYVALHHGQASAVAPLAYSYPIFVALGSVMLGERPPGLLVALSLALALGGAFLVVGAPGGLLSVEPVAVALICISSLCFAGYILLWNRVISRTPPLTGALWVNASAGTALLAFAAVRGDTSTHIASLQWGLLLAMGVTGAVALTMLFQGIRRIGPVRTAILGAFEPLSAAAIAFVALGDPLRVRTVTGGLLILAGATLATLARPAPPPEPYP